MQEARRNSVVTPFDELAAELAIQLEQALLNAPELPGKFGFAIDTGAERVLADVSADIRLERAENGTLLLRADGCPFGTPITTDQAVEKAVQLAAWFAKTGAKRMKHYLAEGHALPAEFAPQMLPAKTASAPVPGPVSGGTLIGFAFGVLDMAALNALVDRKCDIRTTPWRMLLVEGHEGGIDIPGAILDSSEPLLRVDACIGAPGCTQAMGETRSIARALAPFVPAGQRLHVSGCAKGCARTSSPARTLLAEGSTFSLFADGGFSAAPDKRLTRQQILANPSRLFEKIGRAHV